MFPPMHLPYFHLCEPKLLEANFQTLAKSPALTPNPEVTVIDATALTLLILDAPWTFRAHLDKIQNNSKSTVHTLLTLQTD